MKDGITGNPWVFSCHLVILYVFSPRVEEFSRGNAPSNELQIYTWSVGLDCLWYDVWYAILLCVFVHVYILGWTAHCVSWWHSSERSILRLGRKEHSSPSAQFTLMLVGVASGWKTLGRHVQGDVALMIISLCFQGSFRLVTTLMWLFQFVPLAAEIARTDVMTHSTTLQLTAITFMKIVLE